MGALDTIMEDLPDRPHTSLMWDDDKVDIKVMGHWVEVTDTPGGYAWHYGMDAGKRYVMTLSEEDMPKTFKAFKARAENVVYKYRM